MQKNKIIFTENEYENNSKKQSMEILELDNQEENLNDDIKEIISFENRKE